MSCFVGTMDLPSRTHWTVEYRLPPDKAYVESKPVHYNTTPLYQSYYVWMNTAAKAGDDLQFTLPGNFHMGHNYDVPEKPWPISEDGRDLSWYKNNNFGGSKSYFAVGELEDFAGGYWHTDKFGFGHWARYEEMPGTQVLDMGAFTIGAAYGRTFSPIPTASMSNHRSAGCLTRPTTRSSPRIRLICGAMSGSRSKISDR